MGARIRRILRSRLPERLAGQAPELVVEIGVGLLAALAATAVRVALSPLIGDVAPYALVFVAVAVAAVVAGWRSGLVAMIAGQLLAWYFVVEPMMSFAGDSGRQAGLLVASSSQLVLLIVIGLYQREADKGVVERERRLALLDEALREIDHRTRNNYQTMLALIELQAGRENDARTKTALLQVIERIRAIANASQQLAVRSADLAGVRLDDHLCGLVAQIGRGLSRDGIDVDCEVDEVTVSAEKATSISIIVNELVTNAIKHAFNGEGSGRVLVTGRDGAAFELIVTDDGRGMGSSEAPRGSGLGTRLVDSFARQLGAHHEIVSTERGTTHRLLIPSLA